MGSRLNFTSALQRMNNNQSQKALHLHPHPAKPAGNPPDFDRLAVVGLSRAVASCILAHNSHLAELGEQFNEPRGGLAGRLARWFRRALWPRPSAPSQPIDSSRMGRAQSAARNNNCPPMTHASRQLRSVSARLAGRGFYRAPLAASSARSGLRRRFIVGPSARNARRHCPRTLRRFPPALDATLWRVDSARCARPRSRPASLARPKLLAAQHRPARSSGHRQAELGRRTLARLGRSAASGQCASSRQQVRAIRLAGERGRLESDAKGD